jgi:hypothetical protein
VEKAERAESREEEDNEGCQGGSGERDGKRARIESVQVQEKEQEKKAAEKSQEREIPPFEPSHVVPPDLNHGLAPPTSETPELYLHLRFSHPDIPDLIVRAYPCTAFVKVHQAIAKQYGVKPFIVQDELRFLWEGVVVQGGTFGDLIQYDEEGTREWPIEIEVCPALVGGPICLEDYERHRRTGEPLPRYRNDMLRILKPLPTDPYLPPSDL